MMRARWDLNLTGFKPNLKDVFPGQQGVEGGFHTQSGSNSEWGGLSL